MRNLILMAALAATAWWLVGPDGPESVVGLDGSLSYPGYTFTNGEEYTFEARVLGREDYRFGREAELSPTDLAIGWGPMASDEVLAEIEVSQSNRWYHWRTQRYPIPRAQIESHSANVHLVPGSEQASRELARVRTDDRIRLVGQLVDVVAEDGWRWRSSRSRTDTGNGACELLLLERIDWI